MRPKNSSDKTKRKIKTILNGANERNLISDYESGNSIQQLTNKYDVTKSYISSLFSRRNIRKRIDHSYIKILEAVEDIGTLKKNICGIYGIYFLWKYNKDDPEAFSKVNDIKIYIGSSINIKQRLGDHIYHLNNNTHYNKLLNSYFNNSDYIVKYCIIKRCNPENIMQEERVYQYKFSRSCLLNSWLANNESDLSLWLKKAITSKAYKNYKITDKNCWEPYSIHKSGYGRFSVILKEDFGPGTVKYFSTHRVAYWEKYAEYPELIRHRCGNFKCRNPDHLIKGNHRDNSLDKRGDFPDLFEKKWLEFNADPVKLSKYFSYKWIANQKWKDDKISCCIYDWEKKLDLRNKYPEILESNKNRRFNIKIHNKKKKKTNKMV